MAYTDPNPPKKTSATLHFKRGKVKKTFTPTDVRTGDKNYGPESSNKPTPGFIKDAQRAKVDVVHKDNGLSYRAGHTTETKEPDSHQVKTTISGHIPKRQPGEYEKLMTRKKTAEIRQKSAPGPKRRMPRVKWLEGRNKRTESGF